MNFEIDLNPSDEKCPKCGKDKVLVCVPEGNFFFHVCADKEKERKWK